MLITDQTVGNFFYLDKNNDGSVQGTDVLVASEFGGARLYITGSSQNLEYMNVI
jgi:hypothetical protein